LQDRKIQDFNEVKRENDDKQGQITGEVEEKKEVTKRSRTLKSKRSENSDEELTSIKKRPRLSDDPSAGSEGPPLGQTIEKTNSSEQVDTQLREASLRKIEPLDTVNAELIDLLPPSDVSSLEGQSEEVHRLPTTASEVKSTVRKPRSPNKGIYEIWKIKH
jgi:hypothetical protein